MAMRMAVRFRTFPAFVIMLMMEFVDVLMFMVFLCMDRETFNESRVKSE